MRRRGRVAWWSVDGVASAASEDGRELLLSKVRGLTVRSVGSIRAARVGYV